MSCRSPGRKPRQVAGQEAQALAGLHRGAGEDDPVHLPAAECGNRRRHGQVGLAGAGGAHADGHGVLQDGLHVFLLAHGLGLDGLALGGDAHHVPGHLLHLVVVALADEGDEIAHLLLVDGLPLCGKQKQTVYSPASLLHLLGLAGDFELGVAIGDADVEGLLNAFDVLIEGTEHADDLFHALGVDDSVHVMLPLRTDRWDRRGR